jgi:hypothetical protein
MAPRWAYVILISLLAFHIFFLVNSLKILLLPLWPSTKPNPTLDRLRRQLLEL